MGFSAPRDRIQRSLNPTQRPPRSHSALAISLKSLARALCTISAFACEAGRADIYAAVVV
jgi:hypothetical protein